MQTLHKHYHLILVSKIDNKEPIQGISFFFTNSLTLFSDISQYFSTHIFCLVHLNHLLRVVAMSFNHQWQLVHSRPFRAPSSAYCSYQPGKHRDTACLSAYNLFLLICLVPCSQLIFSCFLKLVNEKLKFPIFSNYVSTSVWFQLQSDLNLLKRCHDVFICFQWIISVYRYI